MSGKRARAVIARRARFMRGARGGKLFKHRGLYSWGRSERRRAVENARCKSRHAAVRARWDRCRRARWNEEVSPRLERHTVEVLRERLDRVALEVPAMLARSERKHRGTMSDNHEAAGAVLALVTSRAARYRIYSDTWPGLEGPRLAVELLGLLARSVELLARAQAGNAWRQAPIDWRLVRPSLELAQNLFDLRTVVEARA